MFFRGILWDNSGYSWTEICDKTQREYRVEEVASDIARRMPLSKENHEREEWDRLFWISTLILTTRPPWARPIGRAYYERLSARPDWNQKRVSVVVLVRNIAMIDGYYVRRHDSFPTSWPHEDVPTIDGRKLPRAASVT
jgi:hypothetical protein